MAIKTKFMALKFLSETEYNKIKLNIISEVYGKMKIGVQMYSLRNYAETEGIEKTFAAVSECGFECVEPVSGDYGIGCENVGKLMRKFGLVSYSIHLPYTVMQTRDELEKFQQIFGFDTAVIPYIEPRKFYDEGELKRIITGAAENALKLGLNLAYHNHNFEFERENALSELPNKFPALKLEPDVFWLTDAGREPLKFLRDNARNIALIHVKEYGENAQAPNPVVGEGKTDAKSILKFAKEQNHTSVILEYEKPCSDELTYLKSSLAYMREAIK